MATYNGARYIRQQLESILLQLPGSPTDNSLAEVIVSDDGSTDETLRIIQELGDARVRILPAGSRLGPIYNFERALREAKGDVIFLSDQDDIWLPGKVHAMLEALGYDGSTFGPVAPLLAIHDANIIDGEGAQMAGSMWQTRPYKAGVFSNWLKNSFSGCCMSFRRELLASALPFPKDLPMHDQWLGILAERRSSVVAVHRPLIGYRVHTSNATNLTASGALRKKVGFVQRLRWRLNLLKALLSAR
ncbi:MAG: glycosyltransferase family 2 protein [Fibrobacter sp.]|nr:glycosyltransferase family 2 protein [Fibrobacter sp.]